MSWPASHLVHGFVNIFTGLIEAIPMVGTITYLIREKLGNKTAKERGIHNLVEKPAHSWIGYKNYQIYLLNEYGITDAPLQTQTKTDLNSSKIKNGFTYKELGPYLISI